MSLLARIGNFSRLAERSSYQQRVNAWCMYDWANSAFATTIMAAVLPIYYSQVAAATLPNEATATAYWTLGLSLSLLIVAVLSPILGTISDMVRSKKRFLTLFAALGVVGTGLLVLVDTGDWLLASLLFVVARIGFTGANVFYDALLPHVAREEDQDSISARGFAWGYLGGGLLLAINVPMILFLPGTWGSRLSFFSVALWWAGFSLPLLLYVPEPPAATISATQTAAEDEDVAVMDVWRASFRRLGATLKDARRYRELFKFLVAFLIYNDAIGTIIGVASIYGAEMSLGTVDLILALLLVQFVGIPFSLIFGRLPRREAASVATARRGKWRPARAHYLAFILFNAATLPLLGIGAARALPGELTGAALPAYTATQQAVGQGIYEVIEDSGATPVYLQGAWTTTPVAVRGADEDVIYAVTSEAGDYVELRFWGQRVELTHSMGPDHGQWRVEMDGEPLIDPDTGEPLVIDASRLTYRYGVRRQVQATAPGEHTLRLVNVGDGKLALAHLEVLPPLRRSNLLAILGALLGLEVLGVAFAAVFGRPLFGKLAASLDTRRSIVLSLVIYAVIAVWGYFVNSVVEFWFLAWMVAMVQGGSQALSRSLYARLSPKDKSGEFFGLFGVMEKFSAILGPLIFAGAVGIFGSSRPAILSLILFFAVGIVLLRMVDVEAGQRLAHESLPASDAAA